MNNEEFLNKLREAMPEMSRRTAESFIGVKLGSTSGDPTDLIRRTITLLPPRGRIRKKKDRLVVRAIAWLMTEVPQDSLAYPELYNVVTDLRERAGE